MSFGPLFFAAPWALAALIALPAIWLLLRATPPAPKRIRFAPLRLLLRLAPTPETPRSAPWWLILFRLLIAALVIIALADPVWRPDARTGTNGPLLVVLDDGWPAASRWRERVREARSRLEGAVADGRLAGLLLTASDTDAPDALFTPPGEALTRLNAAEPRPWRSNRLGALVALSDAFEARSDAARVEIIWISDGTSDAYDAAFASQLVEYGSLRVLTPGAEHAPLALLPAQPSGEGFTVTALRADPRGQRQAMVRALSADGLSMARAELSFADGQARAEAGIVLPLDLRNRVTRIDIENEASAGALQLLGDAWRRPRIGLIEPPGGEDRQPLLSDLFYAEEALSGFAEPVRADLDTLLASDPAALVMVDAARSEDEALADFVASGGLLIRFAGPRLAARGDDLVPTRLREGGRLFGGAMAWGEPQALGAFPQSSPFAGLSLPGDVRIDRQVLAEPEPGLDAQVWARLADGTPLVTWARRGDGLVVLFHVTAGPDWSNLALSGLFPAMLERVAAFARNPRSEPPTDGAWSIERALSGAGQLVNPPAGAQPVPATAFASAEAGPQTPPGLYTLGPARETLNAVRGDIVLEPLARDLPGAVFETLDGVAEQRLAGSLLVLAAILFALDVIIALAMAGRLPALPRTLGAGAIALLASVVLTGLIQSPAMAQTPPPSPALENALDVRLAYVLTGDARIDAMSEAGLTGLSREITRRSAIEPVAPRGVDIETDPILYFPVLYWPVTLDAPSLSQDAAEKLEAYIQAGGLIVFDTQDAAEAAARIGPHPGLVRVLEAVDVPALMRAPEDHVLTRTFYITDGFPGRHSGGAVWVEADPDGSSRDGTSGVVIGSADWAAAWAVSPDGGFMAPVEGGARQREMAYRFGVNLAMYALTGNYKEDQVHVSAILERLGREP
ncbi:MAG: DUF4159 domain-containing protein [Pseudomonadota bacterium]